MKNERLGMIMIAASVVVISLIMWLVYAHRVKLHHDTVRIQGVALTRALSGAELSQLVSVREKSLVATLVSVQASSAFAYVTVVSLSGAKLFEVAAQGAIVPAATMPSDPPSWFGEHSLVSPGNDKEIREFFAPVLNDGNLAGFIRAGYYATPHSLFAGEVSYAGLLALPVFLLTAVSYFLLRREIRPLAAIGARVEELGAAHGLHSGEAQASLELRDYALRFDKHVQRVQSRIAELEMQHLEAHTSNRLLAYKQEKTQVVLDAIPEAVLVLDDASAPVFANAKVEPFLGMSPAELIGKPPELWCRNNEVLALVKRLRHHAGSAPRASAISYSPEDHPEQRIAVAAVPLMTPRDAASPFGTLLTFRDVSAEYFARQAGTDFVAHVSHELKTPLNTLLAYSELLLDYANLSESDRVNAINVIHDEVERAAGLINNLLNIAKLESGTLPIARQRVKLGELLRDSAEKMLTNAVAKGVSLELKIPPDLESIALDKDLFRIAIDNLLSNAIKYSDPGGKVTLSAVTMDDHEMKISVSDQGIGISPEDCEKVFDKYYRSHDDVAANRSGHGLGLYLARQIVELHHGRISVHSVLGKGTEFTIQFSVQSARLQEPARA